MCKKNYSGDTAIDTRHITTTTELEDFCAALKGATYVAVDTEFWREKTYYPKLCLLQIATPKIAATIDVLADGIDLTPAWELLYKPNLLKVFHAAFQDVEIFVNLHGKVPTPFFDTQIAAEFCGFSESVAYDSLVKSFCGTALDKSSRVTDWKKRPLTNKQLAYALNDVSYLCRVYEKLYTRLEKSNRRDWYDQEITPYFDADVYKVAPKNAWQKIKIGNLKPRPFVTAQHLSEWREMIAQKQDLPRRRVLSDEALIELAQRAPKSLGDMEKTRFAKKSLRSNHWDGVLQVIHKALTVSNEDLPDPHKNIIPPAGFAWKVDLLKVLLKYTSEKERLSTRLIATSSDLNEIVLKSADATVKPLQGWRREVFGEKALALLKGDLNLSVDGIHLSLK